MISNNRQLSLMSHEQHCIAPTVHFLGLDWVIHRGILFTKMPLGAEKLPHDDSFPCIVPSAHIPFRSRPSQVERIGHVPSPDQTLIT